MHHLIKGLRNFFADPAGQSVLGVAGVVAGHLIEARKTKDQQD